MCLAIPGKIVIATGDQPLRRTAKVSFGGTIKEVSLAYTPQAKEGDYVMVHVGFALSIVDETEANQVFEDLKQMSAMAEQLNADDACVRSSE